VAIYKRKSTYWYEFTFRGKRIRESAGTAQAEIARIKERQRRKELEEAEVGIIAVPKRTILLRDAIADYLETYAINHRPKTYRNVQGLFRPVLNHLGHIPTIAVTEKQILRYMMTRQQEGVGPRTINMELSELSRAIGQKWSVLWPKVKPMEQPRTIGRCLTEMEELKLLTACHKSPSPTLYPFVRIALLTGMRHGEIANLTWSQINLNDRTLRVGKAKTVYSEGRIIPLNDELYETLRSHMGWYAQHFGEIDSSWYIFPSGEGHAMDPTIPIARIKRAWTTACARAGVRCRFHDLRHTVATKLAEQGTPEETMRALLGHMSREMLERYSHIRIAAKREAVRGLSLPKIESA
jgi:integrase